MQLRPKSHERPPMASLPVMPRPEPSKDLALRFQFLLDILYTARDGFFAGSVMELKKLFGCESHFEAPRMILLKRNFLANEAARRVIKFSIFTARRFFTDYNILQRNCIAVARGAVIS